MSRKILFIAPLYPLPTDVGQKMRILHLVNSCGRDHDVTLVAPRPDEVDTSIHSRLLCAEVRYATEPQIASFAKVINALNVDDFDLIWVERARFATLVAGHERKTIVDLDDIMYKKTLRDAVTTTNPLHALAMMPRVLKHWMREVAMARRYLAVVVCSDEDNRHLRAYGLQNVRTIPNGVDIGRRPLRTDRRSKSSRIAFVGNMRYRPNRDAIDFFSEEILPALRGSIPSARLDVIGPGADPSVRARFAGSVRFLGFIEDLDEALATYDVFLAPLRLGGGTKLKVLVAMGNGVPIVTTPVGAEGLGLEHGVSALVRTSASELAGAIVDLHSDPKLALDLSTRAYELAIERFCWEKIREATSEWLGQIIHTRKLSSSKHAASQKIASSPGHPR